MTTDQLEQLLTYRMAQAHETLREAEILLEAAALRGAVNRAYYAMFYALLALLATQQFGASKHSSVIALFDREFVKTGIFPRDLSRTLHLAFDRRQRHDYGELAETLSPQTVGESLIEAHQFVAAIDAHLRSLGHLSLQ